jgi:hypothetical protein
MGVSKGGGSRFSPFGASKSFAFAQHINTQEFSRFSAGTPGAIIAKLLFIANHFILKNNREKKCLVIFIYMD